MKFLFILIFITSFFHSFSQKVNLDTVLFSERNNYVLMYDFYLQERNSVDVWNIYSTDSNNPKFSIILDSNNYYSLNRNFLIDSNIIEKITLLNIDSLINKYSLRFKGIEITKEVQISKNYINKRTLNIPVENTDETESHKVTDIEIKWIYEEDTISTFIINDIDYIDEFIKRARPETIYSKEGYIKGYLRGYTAIFKSIDKKHFFIFSEISASYLDSITSNEPEIKEPINGGAWSDFWSYRIEKHRIRIIE